MNKIYKTAVIGGGASGLLCAAEAVTGNEIKGDNVIVLEKNDRVGKKLIATGNGQGNVTNSDLSLSHYHGSRGFIEKFFSDGFNTEKYLYRLGIPLIYSENGKGYPLSKQASAVLDVLREYLVSKNCVTETDAEVTGVKKDETIFEIKTKNKTYYAENVVLCTGGKAGKQFGTDGKAYSLATGFGHKLTDLFPSLVQLKTETERIKGLKGLKEQVKITATSNGKVLGESAGEILFTDYGISGDAVFRISSVVADKENAELKIEFLPNLTESEVKKIIEDKKKNAPFIPENELLSGIINKKIGQAILKTIKQPAAENVAKTLKNFKLKVKGTLGFDYAQVTKGGISTDDVNPFTMESKKTKGLYLAGETLNVDGDCGGYNLNFAFASGVKAAKSIKEKI